MITLLLLLQLWVGAKVPNSHAILDGHWESCWVGEPAEWAERSYDHLNEKDEVDWTFHMGPRDDFALFVGFEPEGDDHDSPLNLLLDHHANSANSMSGRRTWKVPSLGLTIEVRQGGGSYDNCLGWYVTVTR